MSTMEGIGIVVLQCYALLFLRYFITSRFATEFGSVVSSSTSSKTQ